MYVTTLRNSFAPNYHFLLFMLALKCWVNFKSQILFQVLNQTYLFFFFHPDSRGRMSCLDTGGPTRGSSLTSAPYARRSLPAATTCQNTSKSTVSHEAAGQFTPRTDTFLESLGIIGNTANSWITLIQTISRGSKVWLYGCACTFAPSSRLYHSKKALLFKQ